MEWIHVIKYTLLILAMPIWLPFLRGMWIEFKMAMREQGGLVGPKLSPRDVKRVQEEIAKEPQRQIHVIKPHYGVRQRQVVDPGDKKRSVHQGGPQAGPSGRRPFGR